MYHISSPDLTITAVVVVPYTNRNVNDDIFQKGR